MATDTKNTHSTMFRWLKKKCRRQSLPSRGKTLSRSSRVEEIPENEYHIYEEIPDITPTEEVAYAVVSLDNIHDDLNMTYDSDCPVCKYGRLDTEVPCVCQDSKMPSCDDFDFTIMHHSSAVTMIDKHLPKIPSNLPPRSRKQIGEQFTSDDSSSGYDSNSSSSLEIGIDDDILERLDKMYIEKAVKRGDNCVAPNMGCKMLDRRQTLKQRSTHTNNSMDYSDRWSTEVTYTPDYDVIWR